MKKNIYLVLVSIFMLCAGAVTLLFFLASSAPPRNNGFKRLYANQKILAGIDTFDIRYDSYYIAGKTSHRVYLANLVHPDQLLALNAAGLDTQRIKLTVLQDEGISFRNPRVNVDSPYFFMSDGTLPAIFKGTLGERVARTGHGKGIYFLDMEPIGFSSFALRTLDGRREARLGKLIETPFEVIFPPELLQKQVDGIFCTEGRMHFDKWRNRMVYVYLYRNQFIVMDSSLQLMYKGETLDTISRARIQVEQLGSAGNSALFGPGALVNRQSDLEDGFLYVNSSMIADNDRTTDFENASVIDVYEVESGRYLHSFYVPAWEGKRFRAFSVCDNILIALYKDRVVSYSVPDVGEGPDPS